MRTSETWGYQGLLEWFLMACWEPNPAAIYATGLLARARKLRKSEPTKHHPVFELGPFELGPEVAA